MSTKKLFSEKWLIKINNMDFTWSKHSSNSKDFELSPKMTPEMCRAIRRQETNAGINYWKTGPGGISVPITVTHEKRPRYLGLTQINLDFPGIFLPNVGDTNKHHIRLKRKDGENQTPVLNRSRTTIMPLIQQTIVSLKPFSVTRKSRTAAVTDLTRLQLADTILSQSSFPGLFSTLPSKTRYLDYFSDEREKISVTNMRKVDPSSSASQPKGASSFMYQTFPAEGNETIAERNNRVSTPESTGLSEQSEIEIKLPVETKPQKSILKNSASRPRSSGMPSEVPNSGFSDKWACSYRLPDETILDNLVFDKSVKLESVKPTIQNLGSLRSHTNVSLSENEVEVADGPQSVSSQKRCVRFTSLNEVHEYTPYEYTPYEYTPHEYTPYEPVCQQY